MRKVIILFSLLVIAAVAMSYALALAKSDNTKGQQEKAMGKIYYQAAGLDRTIEFNAQEQSFAWVYSGNNWNILGDWVVNIAGAAYDMTMTSQAGGVLSGTGAYPSGGLYPVTWVLTGTISGADVSLTLDYDEMSYGATLAGTINANGDMAGTWSDNAGQTGVWSATGDAVLAPSEYLGKGKLHYSDANSDRYEVSIQHVNVMDDMVYFAGPVKSASNESWVGSWLSAAAHDDGSSAVGVDHVWSIFTDRATAKYNVLNGVAPGDMFTIGKGNLRIHTN